MNTYHSASESLILLDIYLVYSGRPCHIYIYTYNEMGTLNNMSPNDQPQTIGAGAYWNGSNRKTLPFNTPNVGS